MNHTTVSIFTLISGLFNVCLKYATTVSHWNAGPATPTSDMSELSPTSDMSELLPASVSRSE